MDYLVIGSGLTGAVIARKLVDHGHKVTIWERRSHIGGNMYDYKDEHGINVHKYGPHTFHTNDKNLYDFMLQYEKWEPYAIKCGAQIDGKFTPTPFNFSTIETFYSEKEAEELKKQIRNVFGDQTTATVVDVLSCENEIVRNYGEFLFSKDYSLYTAKQWGISPDKIDPSVLKRVPLRFSYDEGYFDDEYQVMPANSYCEFFHNLLSHENIEVKLGIEALEHLTVSADGKNILLDDEISPYKIVYTGALDELFGMDEGALPYRSLRFEWHYEDKESLQPYPVTAYPQAEGYTRITEYKKMPVQNVSGTSYAVEYSLPYQKDKKQEPYYPVLTEESIKLAKKYQERANKIAGFYFCGRLADFQYYNMDQALGRALMMAAKFY
ncbi:UDP-galactopyranose mutase [Selenomonas ruminantium]|uniref:UDP-galactopyranose mutase n=1 Tax=Selenomonas ruminantium TaxID=971 RepID=A0A1H0PNM4_SELRU|nr:UDP-galactopyranose mutase [Selenomonas ruminantium]SDP06206.1 UDP-galactopyranose mutase [Selenomonas ruminantium]